MPTETTDRLTDQEAEILRSWLSGNEVAAIAKAKRLEAGHVGRVIDRLCNYNRDLAQQALTTGLHPTTAARQWTMGREMTPVPERFVSPPPPAAVATPAPEPSPPPTTPAPPRPRPAGRVDQLLTEAEQSTVPKVTALAGRIRQQLTELADLIRIGEAEETARQLVAAKRVELAQAERALRAVTGTPDPAAIRAWAREQGIAVHPHGTPSKRLTAAYREAHP